MKELIIHEGPRVEAITSPIPTPGADEVVVRVIAVASNPKDHKYWIFGKSMNQGDDMAGIIHAVGSDVAGFRPGNRVFAFHRISEPHGTYAEYAVAPAITTAHLPINTSFESGATIPLTAFTAAWALYRCLKLPQPWVPAEAKLPLLVYGASSAIGAFAVKLARASNIHPIVAVAGRGTEYIKTLINPEQDDVVLDYRVGPDELFAQMNKHLQSVLPDGEQNGLFEAAFDAVAELETVGFCARVVRSNGRFAHAMPLGNPSSTTPGGDQEFKKAFRRGVTFDIPSSPSVNGGAGTDGLVPGGKQFGAVFMRAFAQGLQDGWLTGHPFEIVAGGLDGVQEGLNKLQAGKASAFKYVYEVAQP